MGWVANATPEQEARSRYPLIISICVIFTVLALFTVLMRLRLFVGLQGWRFSNAEKAIVVSMLCSIFFNAFTIVQTKYGLGLLPKERPTESRRLFIIYNYLPRPFYLFGIGAFKVALCLVSRQIATGATFEKYRRVMLIAAWFSGISQFVFTLMNLFSCVPVRKIFNPTVNGSCLPYGPMNWVIAAVSISTDCFVFFSPLYPICKTSLRKMKKWQLGISFALGLLTTLFSALRMAQIPKIAHGNGDSTMLVLWSAIEMNVGIITTSLPFLGQLSRKCLVLFGQTDASHSYPENQGKSHDTNTRDLQRSRHTRHESIDSGSDVIILRDIQGRMPDDLDSDGIVKTTNVTVTAGSGNTTGSRHDSW